jgi:Zn-dependent membrane protease YugP
METYLILIVPLLIASIIVQWKFRHKFAKYAEIQLNSEYSGKEIAEKMLSDHGIFDVKVMSTDGQLSDHYNPEHRTVNLSTDVFHGRSVAAAAVAAHECGHAIQHKQSYNWLNLRTNMVPIVSISSNLLQWILMLGIFLIFFTGSPLILGIGVAGLALVTIFSLITLPVEFDASKRALAWLKSNHQIVNTTKENEQAKDALWWAAMTYVVAALGSLANLIYYASILFGREKS